MTEALAVQLHDLYREPSKHHGYQSVPDFVTAAIDYREPIDQGWRGDRCRLHYLLHAIPFDRLTTVTDIGANTGYFALSLAHAFPHLAVTACEPDRQHAKFIRTIASAFSLANLDVIPKSVSLRSLSGFQTKDAALLLNVLHHAGYDFDTDLPRNKAAFTEYAIDYLSALSAKRQYLFFQMGSNWGGDTSNPLVPRDAHLEKLRYFASLLVNGGWTICRVAYPTRVDGRVEYRDLPEMVTGALNDDPEGVFDEVLTVGLRGFDFDQFPGEFYRRPLFTCVSTHPVPHIA